MRLQNKAVRINLCNKIRKSGKTKTKGEKNEKNISKNLKRTKGITLVALVVSLIALLILAGVSLSAVFNERGIFSRAEQATIEYRAGSVEEEVFLWKNDKLMAKYDGTSSKTRDELIEDQKSRNLLTDEEAETVKTTGKVTIGSKEINYGEKITLSAEVCNISLNNDENVDCAIIGFYGAGTYEITTTNETISIGTREHFITKNGTYIFNVKNTETGETKTEQVVVNSITQNYELGTKLERVEVTVKWTLPDRRKINFLSKMYCYIRQGKSELC